MAPRTRRLVLWLSAPIITFVVIGGLVGKVRAREETYPHLRVFNDVVGLITDRYVEKADMTKVMTGAMHGLAEGLDPDSAYLPPAEAAQAQQAAPLPTGDVGLDLTRQYWLRVIAARDGSPAAKAGLRTGDYVRAIGDTPTREMSVREGMRRLRGVPGTTISLTVIRGSANDPHVVELVREAAPATEVTSRTVAPGVGYVRIAAISSGTSAATSKAIAGLSAAGARSLIIDVRRVSGGSLEGGLALARLFVSHGTLTTRESRETTPRKIEAAPGDGAITLPVILLVDNGTSSGAELFASALAGNGRADLVGEHTIGRAGEQTLVPLPDGSALWLTTAKYAAPDGSPLHEKGLEPTVAVEEPDVEFGQPAPATDAILDAAIARATTVAVRGAA